jgi:RHS repeat-associated protein
MQWRSNAASCGQLNAYRLNYDKGNRLLNANHWTQTGAVWANTDNYSENNISYDLNGNIKTLNRRGATTNTSTFGQIDLLSYTYDAANPDKLFQIADGSGQTKGFKKTNASANYGYDANGNMTQDNNKVLGITYNHLNLPTTFTVNSSLITMTYTADGEKLTKSSSLGVKNYVSGIEYKGTALEAIYTSEGRCTPNGATAFFYEYTIKDHLGNARVSFRANGAAVSVIQENHYYAFGMEMEGSWAAQTGVKNNYEYNGKELNEDFGLNLSDYGARWYDAAVGRWWCVDPLAVVFASYSTYNFCLNNPTLLIDENGLNALPGMEGLPEEERLNSIAEMQAKQNAIYGSTSNNSSQPEIPKTGIDVTATKQDNGITKYLISVKAAIINFSDRDFDLQDIASWLQTKVSEIYSGMDEDGNQYTFIFNFRVAQTMDQVNETDYLIVFSDFAKAENQSDSYWGRANLDCGSVVFINAEKFEKDKWFGPDGDKTVAHEMGHLFGLQHTSKRGLMQDEPEKLWDNKKVYGWQRKEIVAKYYAKMFNKVPSSDEFGGPNRGSASPVVVLKKIEKRFKHLFNI